MNVYLDKMLQLLPILGVDAFKTVNARSIRSAETDTTLHCDIKGLTAKGQLSDNGLIVFKGSQVVKEHRPSANRWRDKREQLLDKGVLVEQDNCLAFTQNVEFSSPSAAAAIIHGGAANGLIAWKNSQGVALKDME